MLSREQMREVAAAFGKEGGKTRAKNMTPEERKESARKAVQVRWAREKLRRAKQKSPVSNLSSELKKQQKKRRNRKRPLSDLTNELRKSR